MKSPSHSMSDSIRGQSISKDGPGPIEKGRVKQGMSAGVWPGDRHAGHQPRGARPDESAAHFAAPLGSKAGG